MMAELELEGHTLGQKYQHYNSLVQDAIRNNKIINVEDFNDENPAVINLLHIDLASHNRNVEYILKVLSCNDMLYVSRAIKQSDWLINDLSYAHIINPNYFRASLFPHMCSKAIIKLLKYIRHNLKDEKRAEEFYSCEESLEEAAKWLPCCSLDFVQKNITSHIQHLKTTLLRRLCEKSITVLEIYCVNNDPYRNRKALQDTMFLLSSNTDKFLDLVETNNFPYFNKKSTKVLMEKCLGRIIDKFDKYYNYIHLPTFITCLKNENIKDFLLNQALKTDENKLYRLFNLERLFLFIRLMPQKIRFEFVKQVFINEIHESKGNCILSDKEINGISMLHKIAVLHTNNRNYIWYQFAPFNIALQKIHELLGSVSSTTDKISMLETVLTSARNDLSCERIFLEYFTDKHKNTKISVKEKVLRTLILKNNFINYDNETWDILNNVFKGLDVYNESIDSENVIIEAIIIYNIIHKQKTPENIRNKFNFNSLVPYHKKLTKKEKEIIFIYLYDLIMEKLAKCEITNEEAFKQTIVMVELALNLLKDYKKELESYPTLLCLIKDLVNEKNVSWNVRMVTLFNINKTWRKLLFPESLVICQSESVLLNALKHDPLLLEQNKNVFENMLVNDKLSLNQFLGKLSIYWSSNLAKTISISYLKKLDNLDNHQAATRGLSILLPHRHLQELIEKYAPKEAKVDWTKINEIELSVQQQLAKNMHFARVQPPPESILQFAKGDYLQYALPSLLSIFYNLNRLASQKHIPNMLDAPVSLQKHGIRLAISKFESDQLISKFTRIWSNDKNVSIRSVMFKTIFKLLCKEKDSNTIKKIWELMEIFIEDITFQEDKTIYNLLFQADKVPLEIRGKFYMQSYNFLYKLINSGQEYKVYENKFCTTFTSYTRKLIEQLEPDFIEGIILEFIDKDFFKKRSDLWSDNCVIRIISSYLLCAADKQAQLKRYEKILLPIVKQSFILWHTKDFIRNNLIILLNGIRNDIQKYVIKEKKVNPHKMFLLIQEELQHALDTAANYMLLTKWKLTVIFTETLNEHNPVLDWEEACGKVAYTFGNKCNDYLKEDCNKYFPRVYLLFCKALRSVLYDFLPPTKYGDVYRSFVGDKTFIQGYLAAILLISQTFDNSRESIVQELCKNIIEHPSTEIKIHYYNQIKDEERSEDLLQHNIL